ncbi:class D sortase [Parageobacillus sp. VR-IP]|nr:class D sortase [Parageobacillus sp. VR-IP]NUK29823.1 class D sortase [Parageobacillus sp. VR-IP]
MFRRAKTYVAAVCIVAGLGMALWNGYCYWVGYHAVQNVEAEGKKPAFRQASRLQQAALPAKPKIGEQIGTLFIPKLSVSIPIYHGVTEQQLRKGIGHYPKSALPGEPHNMVLSGHRDTVFRQLGQIGIGDELMVKTASKQFIYRVTKVRIVDQHDRTVLVEKPRPTLTVTTCYPFHFFGKAKQRYVLIARLVSVQ